MRKSNFDHDDDREPDRENGDLDQLMDILSDELEEFLAAAAAAGDPASSDPRTEERPLTPVKPLVRLVKATMPEPAVPVEDDNLAPVHRPAPEVVAAPAGVPRWVRVTLPGSAVVVTLTATIAAGQPGVVAVPVAAYGAGWTAYLWWNAAYRPPIRDVAAAIVSALARTAGATAHSARSIVHRAESARTRHENTRTNPA
ncbi:hypothetical protein [Nocardia fusca]|uniref:Uncharacterized protein n=1 Tax=Nocardia fusca TaxID=941183 RepID=A0ABV3F8K4_9NOCA